MGRAAGHRHPTRRQGIEPRAQRPVEAVEQDARQRQALHGVETRHAVEMRAQPVIQGLVQGRLRPVGPRVSKGSTQQRHASTQLFGLILQRQPSATQRLEQRAAHCLRRQCLERPARQHHRAQATHLLTYQAPLVVGPREAGAPLGRFGIQRLQTLAPQRHGAKDPGPAGLAIQFHRHQQLGVRQGVAVGQGRQPSASQTEAARLEPLSHPLGIGQRQQLT